MNGKLAVSAVILSAALAGVGMWYAQEYGFYDRIPAGSPAATVAVQTDHGAVPLHTIDFEGIDADSSPLRWRASFRVEAGIPPDAQTFDNPTPLIGPRWFDCYDARQIGHDLETGAARAVLSQSEIRPDVDRVLAVYPDGRVFGWHQYNDKTPERGVMD